MNNSIIESNIDIDEEIVEIVENTINNIPNTAHKNSSSININTFYDFTYKVKYIEMDDAIKNLDLSKNNYIILEKYDMMYREDLLIIFKLGMALSITQDINAVLDSCTKCIEYLYEYYKENSQIQDILGKMEKVIILPFKIEKKTLFMYLFSIDYFYYFNECLKELYTNNKISQKTLNNLIDKIIEK